MSQECGRTRRVLWPHGGPRTVTPQVVAAQAHLAGCVRCRQFMADMQSLAEAARNGALEEAPAEVRERLFQALATARASDGRDGFDVWARLMAHRVLVAAILILTVGAAMLSLQLRRPAGIELPAELAEDHARMRRLEGIATSDPAAAARWLSARVPFAVHVPVFVAAKLRGARTSLIEGQTGAVIQYEHSGHAVSYFILPMPTGSDDVPREPRFQSASSAGYRVVWWGEPGLLHAMIGGVPDAALRQLAEDCVAQARRLQQGHPSFQSGVSSRRGVLHETRSSRLLGNDRRAGVTVRMVGLLR